MLLLLSFDSGPAVFPEALPTCHDSDRIRWFPHSMEIGYELFNQQVKGIVFSSNVCIHQVGSIMSIHNGGRAIVSDIQYSNIVAQGLYWPQYEGGRVQHSPMWGLKMIEARIAFGQFCRPSNGCHDPNDRGAIYNLMYSNVTYHPNGVRWLKSRLLGNSSSHPVAGLSLDNVLVGINHVRNLRDINASVNAFVRNVSFTKSTLKTDDDVKTGDVVIISAATPCKFFPHDWVAAKTLAVSARSREDCCTACLGAPTCDAGTFVAATGQCYLKSQLGGVAGCLNCTSCAVKHRPPIASVHFGPPDFQMELNPETLGLRNITVQSSDGLHTQAFMLGGDSMPWVAVERPLWQLNVSDCSTANALPNGITVNPSAATNISHDLSPDGKTMYLRFGGVMLPASLLGLTLRVTVSVSHLPDGQAGMALHGTVGLDTSLDGRDADEAQVCVQSLSLPTLNEIPMRSKELDTMFVPNFFGHAGECAGGILCTMSPTKTWDGMGTGHQQHELSYMPNGNFRSMQWLAWWSNSSGRSIGLYAAAHDPLSRL